MLLGRKRTMAGDPQETAWLGFIYLTGEPFLAINPFADGG
jgi:hypothetical protein